MKPKLPIFFSASACFVGLLFLWPGIVFAQTNLSVILPPLPPVSVIKSPVDSFRVLLVMPTAERKAQLAARSPEVRQRLLEKIREYQALAPEEREVRLKATELHWYLKPLMNSGSTNRGDQLAVIPENLREMVAARIAQWDNLSPVIQQMMLTNQAGPGYFVSGSAVELPPSPLGSMHNKLQERFNQLFELTPSEKGKVLATLSEVERRQMEKTLEAFNKLTPPQRRQCVASFTRFADLNAEEQQQFLKNTARWVQMTPADRQDWRELVSAAPKVPPLPMITHKPPPLPPGASKLPGLPTTNGG